MDMRRLLNPDADNGANGANAVAPPVVSVVPAVAMVKQRRPQETSIFTKPSPKPRKPAVAAPAPPPIQQQSSSASLSSTGSAPPVAQADQHRRSGSTSSVEEVMVRESPAATPESRKRPATSEPPTEEAPAAKRGKTRKYAERPIWARLAWTNPKSDARLTGANGASQSRTQAAPNQHQLQQQPPKPNGVQMPGPQHVSPQQNGHPPQPPGGNVNLKPWLQDPPLDNDLILSRQIFGQWENSVCWNQPFGDMEKAVADWIYIHLKALEDVDNPKECVIEIEAKIGKIITKNTDERIRMPVTTAAVLDEGWMKKEARFESQMDEPEHKAMNTFLNAAITETLQPGRVKMQYLHPRETDSFRPLSAAGLQALPPPFRARSSKLPAGRSLKLRTSTNEHNVVTARIVKLHITDLHIYNPNYNYDCRISINLEANMNRAELAPFDELVEPALPNWGEGGTPERRKDRLSYRHLAYSFDLTRVDVRGMEPKYELELEVEAGVLRGCLGGPGFASVVGGFLDNATFLMRQRPAGGA
ncbi:hypothetical protein LTR08_002581 [Meristemomyces frigidus]|nr:hypothetical protein LTR08_002581 [Meristemomyces frigidus]